MELTSQAQAAAEILYKRKIRSDLTSWAEYFLKDRAQTPAKHHRVLLEKLQQITDGTLKHSITGLPCKNLIILMPRGSAKSTYTSIIFPPWFIQRRENCRILACSHSADLIEGFSRQCRNGIERHTEILGYNLCKDSRSVGEWSTDNNGSYYCAGVGAGIVGRRGDAGVIDDYIGSFEDANSETIREKCWNWYLSDFWPCLKPDAIQIIVATRWHEEDLVGRLLDPENKYHSPVKADRWEVIRFPYLAEEDDPLGRPIGEKLWSDYFNKEHEEGVASLPPRQFAGMFQQRPAPEEGDFFLADWLKPYTMEEYEALQRCEYKVYGSADWAVSEKKNSNKTCIGGCILGPDKLIYILPDLFWKIAGPKEVISALVDFLKRRNPLIFDSEKGHISQAWGPFAQDVMLQEHVYTYINEVTVSKDKETRAQSFRGLCSMYRVRFPTFAPWWSKALHELLTFPNGASDDFVDMLSLLGRRITSMVSGQAPSEVPKEDLSSHPPITMKWMKESDKLKKRSMQPLYSDR